MSEETKGLLAPAAQPQEATQAPAAPNPVEWKGTGIYTEQGLNPSFLKSVPAEHADRIKGFFGRHKDDIGALTALSNLVYMSSQANKLAPPPEGAPESVKQEFQQNLRTALGIPDTPEAYKFDAPDLPEGMAWDAEGAKAFAKLAHESNIPPSTAAALLKWDTERKMAEHQAMVAQRAESEERETQALRREFGARTDAVLTKARRYLEHIGLDVEVTTAAQVKALATAFDRMAPDEVKTMQAKTGMGNYRDQANDIMTNPQNPHHAAWAAGNTAEVTRLLALAQQHGV